MPTKTRPTRAEQGRSIKTEVSCEGSLLTAVEVTGPGRGICPVCRQDRMIYDSNLRGPNLLTAHTYWPDAVQAVTIGA